MSLNLNPRHNPLESISQTLESDLPIPKRFLSSPHNNNNSSDQKPRKEKEKEKEKRSFDLHRFIFLEGVW